MGDEADLCTRVSSLWAYPVKSLGGQSLQSLAFDARGAAGDRGWAITTGAGKIGSGKNTRRFERVDGLLSLRATACDGGPPQVHFPDGRALRVDDPALPGQLSAHLARPLRTAPEDAVPHFDAAPVHLVTTAALRWWQAGVAPGVRTDARRLRPNIVLEHPGAGLPEDGWVGRTLQLGEVRLQVLSRAERCVMVGLAQDELAATPAALARIARDNGACLGVYARVVSVGTVRVGDVAALGNE